MIHAYKYFNKLTKTYGVPVFAPEDPRVLFKQLHDFCILSPDKAKEQHFDCTKVIYFADYDQETGDLVPVQEEIFDLGQAFEQLLALKEQLKPNA